MSTINDADFAPDMPSFKKLVYLSMQQLTNFPYIEADFDALTNYGLLCKVVDYLNQVISNNNEQNDTITGLYNAYLELQSYVNNYFDNLDVQEEINKKLDEMAEDGSLTYLIKNYVDPIYQAYEESINGEIELQNENIRDFKTEINRAVDSQSSDIDVLEARMDTFASLTDGSTTGDAELEDIRIAYNGITFNTAGNSVRGQAELVNQIKTNLFPILFSKETIEWTTDTRIDNTGNSVSDATGWKISSLIPVSGKYLLFDYVYQFGSSITFSYFFNFYSYNTISSNFFKGGYNPSNATISTKCYGNLMSIEIPTDAKYVSICVLEANFTSLNIYSSNISEKFIKDGSIPYSKFDDMAYTENLYNGTSTGGTIGSDGAISSSTTFKVSDYIPCTPSTKYYRKNSSDVCLVGCYTSEKVWISRLQRLANVSYFTTPENCYYMKINGSNANMENQVIGRYPTDLDVPYATPYGLYVDDSDLYKAFKSSITNDFSKLYKKNVCILGDSIAYGSGATDRTTDSWVALLGANSGANITNLAVSGASLQYRESVDSEYKSVYTVSTETNFSGYDYVIISAGTNDILANIGEPTDTVNTTACGALNLIIENILTSNPYCQILFFGPMFRSRFSQGDGHNSDDYQWSGKWVIDLADKLQETAEKNHIPNKNLYRTFELNKYNSSVLLDDGLHPNDLGHERLYKTIYDFINISI